MHELRLTGKTKKGEAPTSTLGPDHDQGAIDSINVARRKKGLPTLEEALADLRRPSPQVCRDCGEVGETIGHQGCQYPQDHP